MQGGPQRQSPLQHPLALGRGERIRFEFTCRLGVNCARMLRPGEKVVEAAQVLLCLAGAATAGRVAKVEAEG